MTSIVLVSGIVDIVVAGIPRCCFTGRRGLTYLLLKEVDKKLELLWWKKRTDYLCKTVYSLHGLIGNEHAVDRARSLANFSVLAKYVDQRHYDGKMGNDSGNVQSNSLIVYLGSPALVQRLAVNMASL